MRLIDADRLLTRKMKSKYYHLPNGDIAIPIIDIEYAPTVKPECRKGEWIGEYDGYYDGEPIVDIWRCSECDKVFDEWDDKPDWKYCPNCGSYNGDDER